VNNKQQTSTYNLNYLHHFQIKVNYAKNIHQITNMIQIAIAV